MRILLWHGYLLSGSGSNLYAANLGRIWRDEGHDVLLMCQERNAAEFGFVDAIGDFSADNRSVELMPTGVATGAGRLRIARPNIGRVLPVYVYDEYEGFTAKRFVDLTEEELERYTSANIRALVTAIEEHDPDAIITGHEVMGPYIAREACNRTKTMYVAKLHGSALEYAVKQQDRYRHFASEGLNGARVVTGGSEYIIREASSVVPGWEQRAEVVNPGCDVALFKPQERDPDRPPTIGYVGKFIASKGVHNLLAALGLTDAPELRAVIVGYGSFERSLKDLWSALRTGDFEFAETIATAGDGMPLDDILGFMDDEGMNDAYFKRAAQVAVEWPGRLDHGPLAEVLPGLDALVVPSVVPEAFGMVAAEAAACGVLPICPRHSGIGEVGEALERELGTPELLTFDPYDAVAGIARCINAVLELSSSDRSSLGATATAFARERWSWQHVAGRLLGLAAGARVNDV